MTVIDDIKERVDIVEIVGESVKLRKSGKNYTGFCPFHQNTRTPAFVIFPDSGTWRCFGACNEGGDVFSFLMKKEGWDFRETLSYLADRTGIVLTPLTSAEEASQEINQRLRDVLEAAVVFYRNQLLHSHAGSQVLAYLSGRNLAKHILETFEVGYAPQSFDETAAHLKVKGYTEEELDAVGLLSQRESGGSYDRFRHRIMIPIRDAQGRMVGFGARAVDKDAQPKYLNSPQTILFDKGRILFGLDKARRSIRSENRAVIVEGYMDVIGVYQAGFTNLVSPMGTALSEHQLRTLKRYSRRMVLALDPDAAGSKGTLRGLSIAREAFDRNFDPVFDARGLLRYEGRLDADIRIASLPGDLDPDEVVAKDPELWRALIDGAKTVVDYVMETLAEQYDLSDPKAKSQVAKEVLPLIDDVGDVVERDAYRQKLARLLQVDERTLYPVSRNSAQRNQARATRKVRDGAPAAVNAGEEPLERFCLGVLLQKPEFLYHVDRLFQEAGLPRLDRMDYQGTAGQELYIIIRQSLSQDEAEPRSFWQGKLDGPLLDLAEAAAAQAEEVDFTLPRVRADILASFLHLRKRYLDARIQELRFQQQFDLDEDAGNDVKAQLRQIQDVMSQRERLDRALAAQLDRSL
ncbi:MAG: DNA primase [Anaerolineales bacterium]|nr:DNA primase [Anaerolineales bacterium]